MTAIAPELALRIKDATEDLTVAQTEVEAALLALKNSDRASKTIISDVLRVAFDRLVAAKAKLAVVIDDRTK